jgi:hypothetical protein
MLSSLSSILRRDAPEFIPLASPEEIADRLQRVYDRLGNLLIQIQTEQYDDTLGLLRPRIISAVVSTMEDITFVQMRGLARLVYDATAAEAEIVRTEAQIGEAAPHGSLRTRVLGWVETIKDVVVNLEQIVTPAATFATVAIGTHDITTALAAAAASRIRLTPGNQASTSDTVENRAPKELPPAQNPTRNPE